MLAKARAEAAFLGEDPSKVGPQTGSKETPAGPNP